MPRTTENFLKLATGFKHIDGKNYSYANTEFTYIVPSKGIWGGDLAGGKRIWYKYSLALSIYGGRFVDESFEIPHNRAGLLTTTNIGGPNANDSRFIITLGPSAWLNRKSVAFGEVIYGMDVIR